MRFPWRTVSIAVVSGCLAVVIGAGAGRLLGSKVNQDRAKVWLENRSASTRRVLSEMNTLKVSDTLLDHKFESIEGDTVRLSDVLDSAYVLSVVQPDCGSCVEEIDFLINATNHTNALEHIVFLSSGNPRILRDIVQETGLTSVVLYDHRSAWMRHYDISAFPFNIVVGKNLVVEDIFAGSFTDSDLAKLLSSPHAK